MRPNIKSTRNEILSHHKEILFTLSFNTSEIKLRFHFGGGPRKTGYSVRADHICFDNINACADVSFNMISFRVVLT